MYYFVIRYVKKKAFSHTVSLQKMIQHVIGQVIDSFSEIHLNMLYEISVKKEIQKESFILKQGEKCKYLWFIEKGAVRAYETIDGNERTTYFFTENNFFTIQLV